MPNPDFHSIFIAPLEKMGIHYFVSGSIAAIFYGETRLTMDIDISLRVASNDIPILANVFSNEFYYCPPLDVIAIECARPLRGHFNVIHNDTGLKADFYPSPTHPLYEWAHAHRRRGPLGQAEAWFAPPEYVILWKLEYLREGGSDKHRRDIAAMLTVSSHHIDHRLLAAAANQLGLGALLAEIAPRKHEHDTL